ncbi:MAG: ribosome maturation factor RimM [Lachnospiraceae bacterium]|nr:ribosome maturation factor RimM [Lachnospiraceae bacterium]
MDDNMLQVGVVAGTHGLKGEVKVFPTTDDPERFRKLKQVTLVQGEKAQVRAISAVRFSGKFVIVKFAGFERIEDVEKLKGSPLLIARGEAVPLNEDEYFVADLLDLRVITDDGGELGRITHVIHTGANDVYTVTDRAGTEVLLPAIKDCILNVDMEKRVMRVHLLEGLV